MASRKSENLVIHIDVVSEDSIKKIAAAKKAMKKFGVAAVSTGKQIDNAFKAGSLAIAGFGVAMGLGIKELADYTSQLTKLAEANQVTVETLQKFIAIGIESGGVLEQVTKLIPATRRNLNELTEGAGTGFETLKKIGLEAKDFKGLPIEDSFFKIVKTLQALEDKSRRGALTQLIFGEEDATAVFGLFNQDLTKLNETTDKYAFITNKVAANTRKFDKALTRLGSSFRATITNTVGQSGIFEELAGVFDMINEKMLASPQMFDKVTDAIKYLIDNFQSLLDTTKTVIKLYAGIKVFNLTTVAMTSIGASALAAGSAIGEFSKALWALKGSGVVIGGVTTALKALGAVVARLFLPIAIGWLAYELLTDPKAFFGKIMSAYTTFKEFIFGEDLEKKIKNTRDELFNLNLQLTAGKDEGGKMATEIDRLTKSLKELEDAANGITPAEVDLFDYDKAINKYRLRIEEEVDNNKYISKEQRDAFYTSGILPDAVPTDIKNDFNHMNRLIERQADNVFKMTIHAKTFYEATEATYAEFVMNLNKNFIKNPTLQSLEKKMTQVEKDNFRRRAGARQGRGYAPGMSASELANFERRAGERQGRGYEEDTNKTFGKGVNDSRFLRDQELLRNAGLIGRTTADANRQKTLGFLSDSKEESRKLFYDIFKEGLGGKDIEDLIEKFGKNILNKLNESLLDAAFDRVSEKATSRIGGLLLSGAGALFGGGLKSTGASSHPGGAVDSNGGFLSGLFSGASGKAGGGPVVKGRPYIIGESGREGFIPDQDGEIMPNSMLGGSSIVNHIKQTFVGYDENQFKSLINMNYESIANAATKGGSERGA